MPSWRRGQPRVRAARRTLRNANARTAPSSQDGKRDSSRLCTDAVRALPTSAADSSAADSSAADSSAVDSTAKDSAVARWVLPRDLDEISGLALTADGRLLAHGDERAQISEIDYRRGVIVKQFVVGAPTIKDDLEGIAVANGMVFLLASNGKLYEFREGANGTRVDFITSDTHLGKECEFEGLAFDAAINSLLLACKNVQLKEQRDQLVIYRWKLDGGDDRLSQLAVPLSRILPSIKAKELHPSDITVDPTTGNYLIVASIEEALIRSHRPAKWFSLVSSPANTTSRSHSRSLETRS